jgi:hypothetical protein
VKGPRKPTIRGHWKIRNPIGLWQLSGDLLDSSGNGYDLSLAAGAAVYTTFPYSGGKLKGFTCDGVSYLSRPARTPALDLVANMTIEYLLYMSAAPAASSVVVYGAAGETLNDNYLYSMLFNTAGVPNPRYRYLWENGAGVNVDNYSTALLPIPIWSVTHCAFVRSGLNWKSYLNGGLMETIATAALPATGAGPLQFLSVCASESGTAIMNNAIIGSLCIIGSALTDAQVLEDARYCIPWL